MKKYLIFSLFSFVIIGFFSSFSLAKASTHTISGTLHSAIILSSPDLLDDQLWQHCLFQNNISLGCSDLNSENGVTQDLTSPSTWSLANNPTEPINDVVVYIPDYTGGCDTGLGIGACLGDAGFRINSYMNGFQLPLISYFESGINNDVSKVIGFLVIIILSTLAGLLALGWGLRMGSKHVFGKKF